MPKHFPGIEVNPQFQKETSHVWKHQEVGILKMLLWHTHFVVCMERGFHDAKEKRRKGKERKEN
jgi:hypothetical protein